MRRGRGDDQSKLDAKCDALTIALQDTLKGFIVAKEALMRSRRNGKGGNAVKKRDNEKLLRDTKEQA